MSGFIGNMFAIAAVTFGLGFLCYGMGVLGGFVLAVQRGRREEKAMAAMQESLKGLGQLVRDTTPTKEPWE